VPARAHELVETPSLGVTTRVTFDCSTTCRSFKTTAQRSTYLRSMRLASITVIVIDKNLPRVFARCSTWIGVAVFASKSAPAASALAGPLREIVNFRSDNATRPANGLFMPRAPGLTGIMTVLLVFNDPLPCLDAFPCWHRTILQVAMNQLEALHTSSNCSA